MLGDCFGAFRNSEFLDDDAYGQGGFIGEKEYEDVMPRGVGRV